DVVATASDWSRDGDGTCGFVGAGDSTGPADLGALADNGGPTETMLPEPGSPLLDAIPAAACPDDVVMDQRGVARPQGFGCDIGAVEVEVAPILVRHAGDDRFETAALLSAATFDPGVDVAFV